MSQAVQVSMLLMGAGAPQLAGRTMACLDLCFWLGEQLHFLYWEFPGPSDTWRSGRNKCIFICMACLGIWDMCLFLGRPVQHRHTVMHRGCSLLWLQLVHGTAGSRGHIPPLPMASVWTCGACSSPKCCPLVQDLLAKSLPSWWESGADRAADPTPHGEGEWGLTASTLISKCQVKAGMFPSWPLC